MGQRELLKYAIRKDAQIKSRKEVYVLGMEQISKRAVMKDAATKSSEEESAEGTGQS